jgi:hypothetical protein
VHRPTSYGWIDDEFKKLCDIVYFEIFDFNTTAHKVSASANAPSECLLYCYTYISCYFMMIEIMQYAKNLRRVGVKVIGKFALLDKSSAALTRISATADLRTKLAESIMAVMSQLQLDGLFLHWMWPGCTVVKL